MTGTIEQLRAIKPDAELRRALADADLARKELVRTIHRIASAVEMGTTLSLYQSAAALEQAAASARDLGRTAELVQ